MSINCQSSSKLNIGLIDYKTMKWLENVSEQFLLSNSTFCVGLQLGELGLGLDLGSR